MTVVNSKKRAKRDSAGGAIIKATPEPTDEQPQQDLQQDPEAQSEEPPAEDDNEQPQEEGATEEVTAEPPSAEAPAPVEPPPGQQTLPGMQSFGRRLIPDDEGAAIGLHLLALDAEEERMKRDHKFERDDLKKRRDEYMESRGTTYELWLRQKRDEERRRKQEAEQAEKDARAVVSIASLEEQSQATEPEQEEDDLERRVAGGEPDEGDEGDGAESDPVEAAA